MLGKARETEKQRGRSEIRISAKSGRPNPPAERSRSMLRSSCGLSTVERQAFPKHRGTRPTPGGSRQQVTTEQTYTNNTRERFYFPRSLSFSFFLYLSLLFSFTFVADDQPVVVRRRQSIYRSSTETRRYVGHT